MKNKKNNNIGYKIACLLIGLFVLATVLMAWIGGLSTIPKKTVKASADTTTTDVVASIYLPSPYGTFMGSSYMISLDTPIFIFNFTTQNFSFAVLQNGNTLDVDKSDATTWYMPLRFYNFTTEYAVSNRIRVEDRTWNNDKTVINLQSFEMSYISYSSSENYVAYKINVILNDNTTGYFLIYFIPTPPFQVPLSWTTTTKYFNQVILDITPDKINGYNSQLAFERGFIEGKVEGKNEGIEEGKIIGFNKALEEMATPHTFKDLLNAVFFAPFHFLYSLLNVDLLGVNIFSLFTAIITIGVLSFIVRLFI